MIRVRVLGVVAALAALAALASFPLSAQFGTGAPDGLFIRVHPLGGEWGTVLSNGSDRLQGGEVGSGRSIDLLSVRHAQVPLHLAVKVKNLWRKAAEPGAPAGVEGKPVTGFRITADGRAIRYRGAFAGRPVTDWVRDGDACEAGGASLEAFDVELLDGAPRGTPLFEYRVFFAGSGFTPWRKAGETAEGRGKEPFATAIELRNGGGLKAEVRLQDGSWQPTAAEGEVAGDPTGVRGLTSLRVIAARVPIRYRLKVQGSGWSAWNNGGDEANAPGGMRVEAIQLDLKPSTR